LYFCNKKRWLSLLKIRLNFTLTAINNFTGESAKQPTCVGHSGVQPLLFVIEREGLDFSQYKKREFRLKPTLVRCFALWPVKFFMGVRVRKSFKNSFFLLIYIFSVLYLKSSFLTYQLFNRNGVFFLTFDESGIPRTLQIRFP
jgi:hypothetical protein